MLLVLFFLFRIALAIEGLCSVGFSLVAVSRGYSVVAECELLIEVTSLVAEHQL